MRCDPQGPGARRQVQLGRRPSETWQRREWPLGAQPEGNEAKATPLVVALLAKAPALASSRA